MIKAKVAKGSFISIIGDLDIVKVKKDGDPEKTIPKVRLLSWNYISVGKPKASEPEQDNSANDSSVSLDDFDDHCFSYP